MYCILSRKYDNHRNNSPTAIEYDFCKYFSKWDVDFWFFKHGSDYNGLIVKQTNLDISKGKIGRTFFVTFVYIKICLKIILENWSIYFFRDWKKKLTISILITFVLKSSPRTKFMKLIIKYE